uniref:YTH domain-containing family protein n=2 Tax=Zea mays TaxID=4577 RepID=A0A804M918_MAIZE
MSLSDMDAVVLVSVGLAPSVHHHNSHQLPLGELWVNGSGQFCGVAKMIGPVDFDRSVNYWQQDKWSGQFPVKWHIINDVSNNLLRHIILENNDNKPVTNSRDTQEVKLEQGLQMLTIEP